MSDPLAPSDVTRNQYLKDAQGTVTDIADSAGNKLQHYIYSAFGVLLGIQDANAVDISTNPVLNTSYGYTGREKDSECGLMYYRALLRRERGAILAEGSGAGETFNSFNGCECLYLYSK